MKMKRMALLSLIVLLLLGAVGVCAEEATVATIDLVFDGKTYTDTVQVSWTERYPVPEGGVKWDGTEDYIGFADRENWKVVKDGYLGYAEGQIVFMAQKNEAFDDIEQLAAKHGARIVGYIALTNDYVIELTQGRDSGDLNRVIESLKQDSRLISETIMPNYVTDYGFNTIPTDPWQDRTWDDSEIIEEITWDEKEPDGRNWGVKAIRAVSAWDYEPFMQEANIGIIDSMFDDNHADIDYAAIYDWDAKDDPFGNLFSDERNHGTHVAGIALAKHNNGTGISGVFPKGKAVAIGNLGENENRRVFWCDYKKAITLALFKGARAINISLGWGNRFCYEEQSGWKWQQYYDLFREQYDRIAEKWTAYYGNYFDYIINEIVPNESYGIKDFVIINSAGNERIDARYNSWLNVVRNENLRERLIIVGAVGEKGGNIGFAQKFSDYDVLVDESKGSNWGDEVDIVAPGTNIFSCKSGGSYGNFTGTSQAAPFVTGVAAMLWSINPDLSGPQIKQILVSNGRTVEANIGNRAFRYPMLDAYECVQEAFERATANGTLNVTATNKATGKYEYDVHVSIKPLEICQETETLSADTGLVYPYLKTLKMGQYEVTVSKNGYRSHTEKITVTRDSSININAMLEPTEAPEITKGTLNGAVTFNSSGMKNIEVNVLKGEKRVATLITNDAGMFSIDLDPGTYSLSVNAKGYVPVKKEVTIFRGKTTTENIQLDDSMYATIEKLSTNGRMYYRIRIYNEKGAATQSNIEMWTGGFALCDTANGIYGGICQRIEEGTVNGVHEENGFMLEIPFDYDTGLQVNVTVTDTAGRKYKGSVYAFGDLQATKAEAMMVAQ